MLIFDFVAQLRTEGFGDYAIWDDLDQASQERYVRLFCEEHKHHAVEILKDAKSTDYELLEAMLNQLLITRVDKVNYIIEKQMISDKRVQVQFEIDYRDYASYQKSISGVE